MLNKLRTVIYHVDDLQKAGIVMEQLMPKKSIHLLHIASGKYWGDASLGERSAHFC